MYINSMKDRFYEVLSLCKISVRDLSNHLDIHENVFTRYISNDKISCDIGLKIEELGINSRWILIGKGNIYNETEKGKSIKKLIDNNKKIEDNFIYFKIITWLNAHYSDIKKFETKYGIDGLNYIESLRLNSQISYDLFKALKEDGLNINWIYHNDSSPYNFSKNGRKKKSWALHNLERDNYLYNIIK